MRSLFLTFGALCLALGSMAQNPVIRDQYAADPTARVFNGRVYLYPSHDIPAPEGQRQDWFCMADYHVFSSENLTDWTDHGVIVSQEQVPWGKADAYSMWAPDCVEKDGKYYFYFPNAPKDGRGFAIGVGVSDSPAGPFRLEPEPIRGVSGIDPCVLIDRDGTAYLYWSGMGIRGGKLKANMKELDGELQQVEIPRREGMPAMPPMLVGGQPMEGLPDGFKEGPFAFRRGDWYYLTFPWVRGDKSHGANPTETLAYAMSRSPLGPWDFKGVIMAEHADGCWTNHHSLVEYKGQWYLFYHHNDYSPQMDKRRSARIERVTFRKDGTIEEVIPTLRGVGITEATARIEVDRYSAVGGIAAPHSQRETAVTAFNDTLQPFRGWHVSLPAKCAWVQYDDVDFSMLRQGAYVLAYVRAGANTELSLKVDGRQVARIPVTVITERGPFRRDQSGQWLTLTAPLSFVPQGTAPLVVTCEGEGADVDWVQFRNRPDYFTFTQRDAPPMLPDTAGFIRRWSLLQPIRHEVPSNIILTDSYLEDMVAKELPKVNFNKGKWYAIDSETFNVRVFRFAELTGSAPYNSLFWGTTVIDCPEAIPDVRLAAGSNGASVWWLNDERVLILDGDRRMVEDDGVSARLRLRQGRNVLRFALVNGPGLSDLCVRFVDEKGKPVTAFAISSSNE